MKERMKALWGLVFVVILVVPYALGIWDNCGYIYVVAAAVALLMVAILGRHVTPTFWWQGLRKKKKEVTNKDKGV